MGIFNKIVTAIKGTATEAGEAIVDANAIRILEQEIRDAKAAVEKARRSIADLMAEKTDYDRKLATVTKQIEEYEGYAAKALDKGDEALAMEVAEKIVELEESREYNAQAVAQLDTAVAQQKAGLTQAERTVKTLERESKMVKTTENLQKTTQAVSTNFSATGSKVNSAKDSLERIKARQQRTADRMAAAETLSRESSGDALKDKLAAAGIGEEKSKASDILARLKNKEA